MTMHMASRQDQSGSMARPTNTTEMVDELAAAFEKIAGNGRIELYREALKTLVRLAKSEQTAEPHRDFFTCMDRKLP